MLYGQDDLCPTLSITYEKILAVDDQEWASTAHLILQQSTHQAWLSCGEALADSLLESRQFSKYEQLLLRLIDLAHLEPCLQSSDIWSLYYRLSRHYFFKQEDTDLAYRYINLALTAISSADQPSKSQVLKTYYLASSIVRDYGEIDYAMQLLSHAADLVDELYGVDSFQSGVIQNGIGNLWYTQGKYQQAIPPYLLAKDILSKSGSQELSYIKCIQNLASSLVSVGQIDEAEPLYKEAIKRLHPYPEEEVSHMLMEIYGNLGILYKEAKKYDLSRTYLMRSLGMTNPSVQEPQLKRAELELEMSQLELFLGNHFPALVWAHQACSRLDSTLDIHRVQAFADVGQVSYQELPVLLQACQLKGSALMKLYQENPQRIDELKHSLAFFEQMGPIYHRIRQELPRQEDQLLLPLIINNDQTYLHTALTCASILYAETDDEIYLQSAFRLIEHSRGMMGFEQMRIKNHVRIGKLPHEAFAYGDSLRQAIQIQQRINRERTTTSTSEVYALVSLQQAYRHWQDTLHNSSPTRRSLLNEYSIAELGALQTSLEESNAIWISYHFSGSSGGHMLAIDAHEIHLIPTDVTHNFWTDLEEWKGLLSSPDMRIESWNRLTHIGRALYRQLILPIQSRIQLADRPLTIVPDGSLHGISFAPMLSETVDEMPGNFKGLPYLTRSHSISYAQSATALLAQQQLYEPLHSYSCLGMAFSPPSNMQSGMPNQFPKKGNIPLLGTAQEIRDLQHLISGNYFWGHNATESSFRAHCRQANLLHLAVHGIGDTTVPYLIFQQDHDKESPVEDGFLYMNELSTLSLQSHMAVLSACETGQGDLHQREGMLSMAWAFLTAGSASVVMNQWRAHDQASVGLMKAYYQALTQRKYKAEALQRAQLMYLEEHNNLQSHPAYWAGLVIWGNPDPLWQPTYIPWSMGIPILFSILAFFIGYMRAKKRF